MTKQSGSRFKRASVLFLLLTCLTIFGSPATVLAQQQCKTVLGIQSAQTTRTFESIKELKVMTFNVENLYWSKGKFDWVSSSAMRPRQDRPPQPKKEVDIEKIRNIIKDENPDIAILTEVESLEALQHLTEKNLEGLYRPFLIEGNDPRGINIGFIVKADLPFLVEHQTHKDLTWYDPIDKQEAKVFSRDLPALLLRKNSLSNPFLIILGNHAKSKRNRPGDYQSDIWRWEQYKAAAKIVEDYKKKYPGVPVMLGGDFNTDVNTAPEVKPLLAVLQSGFLVAQTATPVQDRITHTYHPHDGPSEYKQMDDIKISAELAKQVIEARVVRYKDPNGAILPFAKNFGQRELQPSDHFPVIIRISTSGLWPVAQ